MKRKYIIMAIFIIAGLSLTYLFYYNSKFCYNNNALGSYEFIIEDKDSYKGLDLSHHNKIVSFEGISHYDFIYHKATEGSTFVDPKFSERIKKCIRLGMPCGAYHFFSTSSSGKDQFENFKRNVPTNMPLIPVIDIEINKNNWSKEKLNEELGVWIQLCEEYYGVKPIIYSSSWFYKHYNLKQHDCWFWSGDINSTPKVNYLIHQKKLKYVAGIVGKVDYNEAKDIPTNPKSTYASFQ